ncbi:MAG: TetR/AcrR family transcriptional regulator [Alphaproteobacteria bacterium]|nr:TetR/AcrR family transcriptional regulator [Alphaproteobacteria bacterium]
MTPPDDARVPAEPGGAPGSRRNRRRARIIAAATELFLEHGYGDTSIDAVVRDAGGSKSTVYELFGDKNGLFAAVVEEMVGSAVRPVPDIATLTLGLRDTLRHVACEHAELVFSDRHAALMRLVAAEAQRRPELGRLYYKIGPARGHSKLEAYLRDRSAEGDLAIQDVEAAASFFYGMLLHKWTLKRLYNIAASPDNAEINRIATTVVDEFLALYRA